MAAWVAALGAACAISREARRRRRPDGSRATRCRALGRRARRARRRRRERRHRLARRSRRRADDVPRPRCRRRAPAGRAPARVARDCDHLHVSGYALLASRSPRPRERAIELARAARRAGQRRPLLVEHDPRLRARARSALASRRSRPTSSSPTRTRTRSSAAGSPGVAWILKRGARGCSFDGDERPRSRSGSGRHDRRGRRARRGLDRRRARPRARGGGAVRAAGRVDAVGVAPRCGSQVGLEARAAVADSTADPRCSSDAVGAGRRDERSGTSPAHGPGTDTSANLPLA